MAEPAGPSPEAIAHSQSDRFSPTEGVIETICRRVCALAIVLMMVMVGAELAARSLLGFSFQLTNEVGGYLLLGIAFLSLPVGQARHAFHRVELVDARLSPRLRALLTLVFDLFALIVTAALLWQFVRFEMQSWSSGETASTNLLTPLWLPRCLMPLGVAALGWTMGRTVWGDLRRLAAASAPLGGKPAR